MRSDLFWLKHLITIALVITGASAARADCKSPFVPPQRSPFYCTSSTPQQAAECRQQADQAYNQQVIAGRTEWQRQQAACEAREQAERDRVAQQRARAQAELERQQRDQVAREQAERQRQEAARKAAETERYIAQQKAEQAAAEAATAKARAEAAEAERRLAAAADHSVALNWKTPVTGGSVTLFGIFAGLLFAALKEWIHASVPKKWKVIAFFAPGFAELVLFLGFGIEVHEPTVADFLKLNLPVGVAMVTGFALHHTYRYAYT